MQNIRSRPSEPRHPLINRNRKSNSNFWLIFGEKHDFFDPTIFFQTKNQKSASREFLSTARSIGSPIFMPFRQRNRCEKFWRNKIAEKSKNLPKSPPESASYYGLPHCARVSQVGFGFFGRFSAIFFAKTFQIGSVGGMA